MQRLFFAHSVAGRFDVEAHQVKDPALTPGNLDVFLQQQQCPLGKLLLPCPEMVGREQSVRFDRFEGLAKRE